MPTDVVIRQNYFACVQGLACCISVFLSVSVCVCLSLCLSVWLTYWLATDWMTV